MMTLGTIVAALVAAGAVSAYWRARRLEQQRSEARVAALVAALDPDPEDHPLWLVAQADGPTASRPLATIAIGFAVVSMAIVGGVMFAESRTPTRPLQAAGNSTAERAAVSDGWMSREPQLALLALRYERTAGALVVKGLVQPRGTAPPTGVTAVVSAFSREGRLVARGDGPLRLQRVDSGARADFAVQLDGAADAARYQVGFRGPEGIIRHVDLRDRSRAPARPIAPASRVASRRAETMTP